MVITVVCIITALAVTAVSGWTPPRESAAVVLPIYFAVLLLALAVSFVASGNTLMHHARTGTIQRAADPISFWWVVGVQFTIAAALLVLGCVEWSRLSG